MGSAEALRHHWAAVQLLLIVLAAAAVLWIAQQPAAGIYGYDSPFHIRYAEQLRQSLSEGRGFIHQFPSLQETFLKDHWADKDLLFHLALIPFTLGDLETGGRVASLVFGALLFGGLFLALRVIGAPTAWVWTLACLLSSATLVYRAGLIRSHVLAIPIALLGAAAIVRGRRAAILIASAGYALTHIGWHLLPGIALTHDIVLGLKERRIRVGSLAWSLAGTAAAVVVNPYFPWNLHLWYVQNIDVLTIAWSRRSPDLSLGGEFAPASVRSLVAYDPGALLFTLIGLVMVAAMAGSGGRGKADVAPDDREAAVATLGITSMGLMVATLLSQRFVEFWIPFSVLFAAAASARWIRIRPIVASARWMAGTAAAVAIAALGWAQVGKARRIIGQDPGRIFEPCASRIRDQVPETETVFTTDWDEFPELYFTAPRQRYLVGLDPTFMYVTSPSRWKLWRDIVEGRVADVHDPIVRTFGCRHLFVSGSYGEFIERADQDPWLDRVVRTADCGVYRLRDSDPEDRSLVDSWRLDNGDTIEPGPRGFVSLHRSTGDIGRAGSPECVVVHGTARLPGPRHMVVAVSSDDQVVIALRGSTVLDSATASPPDLEDLLDQQRRGALRIHERRFGIDLDAGYNDVSVRDCRVGSAWGFFLWVPGASTGAESEAP